MHGNAPYSGPADATGDLSGEQRRALQTSIAQIASRTREFLPDEYVVGSEVTNGSSGVQVTVAVRPPAGNPVSAGFTPEFEDLADDDLIPTEDREEVARGLAASAALQVKHALGDDVPETAR
ncbi:MULTISPECIES: DUF5811 family protein [Halobacterium]|uniref:Uncharacterized protein n=4 Tax=Halobacterium salinarum TaxID=2242 RepID=Q9HNQ1_HALSA|nr:MULTISPECIES: DUF5811 family protein [Halobacterium]AAG20169.1 hypothetical protein VNG_1998H [Halobacterium salinarum NRC-1]MBB6089182.1 hypothetical protein [Halobacterium salinarum]MCF2166237.1 hypothetical protein [Halobacterium salinarum]MCF2167720.1 hypothetical protein [Halobacterium salinarum]MCF2206506.1 hypothetical protein [Halobacterium salinarum]